MAPVSEQQKERYLELVREGMSHREACAEIGVTGTKVRALRNPRARNYDSEFDALANDAFLEGGVEYQEELRKEIRVRMRDRDDKASPALLRMEAEAHLPEYEHRRSQRIRHGQDGPFQIQAIPWISVEALDAMPIEEREKLLDTLRQLQDTERPDLRAIEGGK